MIMKQQHMQHNGYLFSVYRNKDDKLIILDGTARECARAMGLSRTSSFYVILKVRGGQTEKWTIIKTPREVVAAQVEEGGLP